MRRYILALLALLCLGAPAHAQNSPVKFFSAASTNSTLVRASKSLLTSSIIANTTATTYYIKFYNKATAPTCGTDIPRWTVPIPASGSGIGGVAIPIGDGLMFPLGLGFCITAGSADNDTTAAATGVIVNLGITGY